MFTCVPGHYVAFMVLLVPKPFGGADSIGGQLCGDRESPFSGVTSSGRVWREVPEKDARSVIIVKMSVRRRVRVSFWL